MSATGCGDAVCQTEVFLAFEQTRIAADLDDFAPGVQTHVRLRTSLEIGDIVTLEILDIHGVPVGRVVRAVDTAGMARFDYVTVPTPRVLLRATGEGLCGVGHDEITVDVTATGTAPHEPDISAYDGPAH